MDEKKFALQREYKKADRKTLLLKKEEIPVKSKSVKQLSSKHKKGLIEFDDMSSLIFLKDGTERKKLNKIDERIKILKTELQSLLGNNKSDHKCNFFGDDKNDEVCVDFIKVDNISQKGQEVLGTNYKKTSDFCNKSLISCKNDFEPSTSSTPLKFSDWLNKTIDEMDPKPELVERNLPNRNNIPLNSELDTTGSSPNTSYDFKSKFFNAFFLAQDQIEKLLYKSFVMQNSEIYLSSSEDNAQEHIKSFCKMKQQNYKKSRKCKKSHTEKLVQSNLNRNCRFSQKGKKRRLLNKNSFLNEVEIIDLDNSLGNKEMPKPDCEVLDVESYDWNEPFDLDENTGFLSNVEVIDNLKKKSVETNNQNPNVSDTVMLESEPSVCYDEEIRTQKKRVWECPVCFEQSKGQEVVATQCGHIFCKNCIENHSSKLGKSCPSCRSDLRNKPLITLFNF